MAVDLADLADPAHTAVLTMEMQRGVIGDLATMPDLARAAEEAGVVANTARLVGAARAAGARVVHCIAEFRADRAGSARNCALIAVAMRRPDHILAGTPSVEVVPELDPQPSDVVSRRVHGLSPFTGTSLDVELRNMGVRTVVATGCSLNVGVFGMVLGAVDLGYNAVLPTDCVAGLPLDYGEAVVGNSLAMLATLTTADELIGLWR